MKIISALGALAAFFALAAPVSAQIPQPDPSSFQTVEEANEARTRAATFRDELDARFKALIAAAEDQNVVVINDHGNYRVLTAKQMDEFVARVQLVYLLYPDSFKDLIPQIAESTGMPEFVVESALEGDANELAVSQIMSLLREKAGVTPDQARGVAMNYESLLTYLDTYVQDVDARIAQLQATPATIPDSSGTSSDGTYTTKDFLNPMVNGVPLDHCLIFPDCGSSAANKFCKDQGMLMSYFYDTAPMPKTWVPGIGKTCEATVPGQCVGFTKISCRT